MTSRAFPGSGVEVGRRDLAASGLHDALHRVGTRDALAPRVAVGGASGPLPTEADQLGKRVKGKALTGTEVFKGHCVGNVAMMATNGNAKMAVSAIDKAMADVATGAVMAADQIQSRVDEIMRARGLNQADLARASGIQPPTLSKIVKGKRGVTPAMSAPLARALQVSVGALHEDIGAPIPPQVFSPGSDVQPVATRQPMEAARLPLSAQVPVMGTVSCGSDGQFEVNLTDGPLEYVDVPAKLVGVPDIFALFVAGDSMAGVWAPGDTVYVSRKRPVTPGSYAVVLVEMGLGEQPAAYLKEYVSGDNRQIILRQYNPQTEKVIERARVKEMWRALHWRELL